MPGDARGAVLVVAADRDDRRVLFDALDAHGFDAIYSARDFVQARAFLEQDPQIELVLLEFRGDAADASAFCAELRQYHPLARIPVVGIADDRAEAARLRREHAARGIGEWIAKPIEIDSIAALLRTALPLRGAHTPAPTNVDSGYQFAFDGSLDELVVVDPLDGRVLDVNTAFVQRSGWSRVQALAGHIQDFDAALPAVRRADIAEKLARDGSVQWRGRKPRVDGSTYAADIHVRLAVQGGRLVHFYTFREIGDLGRYQLAMSSLGQLVRAGGGDDGMKAALRILIEWLGLDFAMLVEVAVEQGGDPYTLALYHRLGLPEEMPDPLGEASVRRVLAGKEILHASRAWREAGDDAFVRARRFECLLGVPLIGERRDVVGALVVARREALGEDRAAFDGLRVAAHTLALELELRRAREQGRASGLQDPLTALPNRLLFNDRLNSAINEARRTSEMFAVLFVDLDRFKNINDSLGHAVGDQVLIAVAKRLRASVRASDTLARYAGDEFTLILRHIIQRDDVVRIAEKVVRAMEAPLALAGGLELNITASLGVSFYPDDATDAERLLKHADVAMYSAKGMGRNNFQVYVAVPEEAHQQRLALESKLRHAERNGELRVYYQPQIDGQSEDIVGMEALIRWEHPELGMISPGFFIPLAEESGLIVSIGEWVLRAACRDARRWQTRFGLPLRIGVNLSPLQLRQPSLVERVAAVLRDVGMAASLLDLEVTESVSMKSIPNLQETLHGLRDLGCSISIDDFGTGQSSLDYIKRFPSDRIKIDQAFVRNIGVDPDDEAIVQATISMAHNLNRQVVAEGVEIEQHLDFLRAQGCDVLQGFLFCRPLPATAFEALLGERERLLGGRRSGGAA